MPQVLCTALGTESGPHFEILRDAGFQCDVVERSLDLWDEETLISVLKGYAAVVAGSEPFTAGVLRACDELRVLSRTGVGWDAIDVAECDRRGVVIATTPGVNHHAVAEHTIAMLMGLARGFPQCDSEIRQSVWQRIARPRVMSRTLGLVGLGRIGQAVAWRAIGLGMNVVAYDPFPPEEFLKSNRIEMLPLDELLQRSDFVSLHLPATADTQHVINARAFATMKAGAVLINTARGPLVDEPAMITALQTGTLRAAGLDVFETEPLPSQSPLLTMHNVLLSGHIAGLDRESHHDTCEMAAHTIVSLFRNEWPQQCIQNLKSTTEWAW
jgi:phosphoglycerate dehydrogenase-like enzyme